MDLPIYSIALIGLGLLIAIVGGLMLLVAAFRESIVWGLVVIFAPCGNIIYCCVHWAEAKSGFLTNLAGTVVLVVGIFTIPGAMNSIMDGKWEAKVTNKEEKQPPAPNFSAQIAEKRKLIEDLQTAFATYGRDLPVEYKQLEKRRSSLKPGDDSALTKFNEDAAAYQAKNQRHRQIQQEMTSTQAQLDLLLEQRSRAAAQGRPTGSGGGPVGSKPVVM